MCLFSFQTRPKPGKILSAHFIPVRLVKRFSLFEWHCTYEAVPFRFIAGNQHPDHDTLATLRRPFLPERKDLFVRVLLLAREAGVLKLGTISRDGTKMRAEGLPHDAVRYKR